MDNERPNDNHRWGSRLEEPGALPETGLTDKEAAWDKLYDRLREEETPRRKKLIWLWAAAACFLLVVAPAAFFLKERNSTSRHAHEKIPVPANTMKSPGHPSSDPTHPQTNPVNEQNPSSASQTDPRSAVRIDKSANDPNRPNKVATTLHFGRREPRTPGAVHTPSESPGKTPTPRDEKTFTSSLHLVFKPIDLSKPPVIATATTPQKQRRVIHINELEPLLPTPAMVSGRRTKPAHLRLGFGSPEAVSSYTDYYEPDFDPAGNPIHFIKSAQNP